MQKINRRKKPRSIFKCKNIILNTPSFVIISLQFHNIFCCNFDIALLCCVFVWKQLKDCLFWASAKKTFYINIHLWMKNNVLFLTTMNLNNTAEFYNIKSIKAVINHRRKHDEFAKSFWDYFQ